MYQVQNMGTVLFSLFLWDTCFMVKKDLGVHDTPQNFKKMCRLTVVTMLIPLLVLGFFGYYGMGSSILDYKVSCWVERPRIQGKSDYLMM